MSNTRFGQVVSLDEYRRARTSGERAGSARAAQQTVSRLQSAPAVWVYWVPVWVW
jgi:hypothetical protein